MKTIAFLIMNMDNKGGTERVVSLVSNALTEKYKICIFSCRYGEHPNFALNPTVICDSLHGEIYTDPLRRRLKLISILKEKVEKYHNSQFREED